MWSIMAVFKCKMCGGDIAINEDKHIAMCEYCGSTMTLPKASDEQRLAAFNRGNHFRRAGEFDKAVQVYERMIQEDNTDAEAHWCCALSRFGIEYVEDPDTYEWIPTCHRLSFDNFLEDIDYLAAVEHSDGIKKKQYIKDGIRISEVQKSILATSQNEKPFDIFICYKESEEDGSRTKDSIMAQDIYYQLTEKGFRVFFARITLENVAGREYEPYIFAALQSAKVMIAVGTTAEHFNAVWVKNEWSRYLALMKRDRSRLLLPCYKDMDPYDLPEALSVLQSYDMSKIGFIQDLIRGVEKVVVSESEKTIDKKDANMTSEIAYTVSSMLKRGGMALEDGEWKEAEEFFERALDMDAECSEAYFGKVLAGNRVRNAGELIRMRLEQYGQCVFETLPACEEDTAHVEEMAAKYTVNPEYTFHRIEAKYRFDLGYPSAEADRTAQLQEEKQFWAEERNMTRAKRFAEGDRAALETENKIYSAMEQKIEEAAAAAEREKQKKCGEYRAFLLRTDDEVQKESEEIYASLEEKYEQTMRIMEELFRRLGEGLDRPVEIDGLMEQLEDTEAMWEGLAGFRDAEKKKEECKSLGAEALYQAAVKQMETADSFTDYDAAYNMFRRLNDYKDSEERAGRCADYRYKPPKKKKGIFGR